MDALPQVPDAADLPKSPTAYAISAGRHACAVAGRPPLDVYLWEVVVRRASGHYAPVLRGLAGTLPVAAASAAVAVRRALADHGDLGALPDLDPVAAPCGR